MAIGRAKYETVDGKSKLVGHDLSYEGCVLETRERNYHDDSDFYAIVWDEAEQRLKEVEYATTRFYTYDDYARVDATDEVKAKANAYIERFMFGQLKAADEAQSKVPAKDKKIRVVGGRKVPKGTEGIVFWAKVVNYDPYGRAWGRELRIGFKDEAGTTFWTMAKNVEVQNPQQYLKTDEELKQAAKGYKNCWHIHSYGMGLAVL